MKHPLERRLSAFVVCIGMILSGFAAACGGGTTTATPAPPTLVSPPDRAVLDNGCDDHSDLMTWDFAWSEVPGATGYHLWVKNAGGSVPMLDQVGLKTTAFRYVSNSYTPMSDGWQWRVRAVVNGGYGEWSELRTFTVEPVNTDCH